MTPDPLRVQLFTVTLDSQAVLTLFGVIGAALIFALAARQGGHRLGAWDWIDLVVNAVFGARAIWVALHLNYYLRAPLQVVAITDGGLHPAGLVLGAAYAIWGLRRRRAPGTWRAVADFVAVGALTAALFERAGCALTACGGGPLSSLAWALVRGDEWREPIALYQVAMLAAALLLVTKPCLSDGQPFWVACVALGAVQAVALWAGRGPEGLLAVGLAIVLYGGALLISDQWRRRVASLESSPGAG